MKKITFKVFLGIAMLVSVIANAQFNENFDAGTTVPAGWTVVNNGDPNGFVFEAPGAGAAHSGTNVAKLVYNSDFAHDDYLITPQFTVTTGVTDHLGIWVRERSTTFPEPFDILLSTTGTNPADFTTTIAPGVMPGAAWTGLDYSLAAYVGQTVYIAFHSTTQDQWELYIDDVVVDAAATSVPGCSTNVSPLDGATNVATGTVNFEWTAAAGATSYDLFYGLTAGSATTLVGNYTTTTAAITVTGYNTTFYWKIVPRNSAGSATGCPEWSFTTEPQPGPPANDNFASAIAISCGTTYNGNTTFATLDEDSAPDGFGADMDAPNVWYSFTGTGTEQSVTLNLCTSAYDTSVLVYTGSTGALTLVAGNDDDATCGTDLTTRSRVSFTSDGLSTYYIAVEGYNVGNVGTFTMDVTCAAVTPPAVTNQTCGSALGINVDNSDVLSDNSFGDVSPAQPTCDLFGSIQDVWFSFVAPASGTVDVNLSLGTMTSANVATYSGACGGLTQITCNANLTASNTTSLTALTSGTTYYIQVWSNAAEQGTFSLRLSDPGLAVTAFDSASFRVYPNPVKNKLNLSSEKNITNVSVFNLLGQEVMTKSSANLTEVDMSQLHTGTYMVKVTADNQVKTIKIVKE